MRRSGFVRQTMADQRRREPSDSPARESNRHRDRAIRCLRESAPRPRRGQSLPAVDDLPAQSVYRVHPSPARRWQAE